MEEAHKHFTEQIKKNCDLLAYAQRRWMGSYKPFAVFDPSDLMNWEDHSRPWDIDHLAPNDSFWNVRNETAYVAVCREWKDTIGNKHILSFEDNRSRQATPANQYFHGRDLSMMLLDQHALDSFSLDREDVKWRPERVLAFVRAARLRLINIYTDWFKALGVDRLL